FRKGWPYEESIRVPLLIRWPEKIIPGLREGEIVSLVDLYSTTVALVGGSPHGDLDGIDFSASLFSKEKQEVRAEGVSISMPSVPPYPPNCGIKWRGIRTFRYAAAWREDGVPWFVFDMLRDPSQKNNLVANKRLVSELAQLSFK
ncbi:MAG: hypothetical protein JKY51_10820, partial [Opitutaceae bacterium]|nr:hypothetical protein [Opitutaceae bacterium]